MLTPELNPDFVRSTDRTDKDPVCGVSISTGSSVAPVQPWYGGQYRRGARNAVQVLLRVSRQLALSSEEVVKLAEVYARQLASRVPDQGVDAAMAVSLQKLNGQASSGVEQREVDASANLEVNSPPPGRADEVRPDKPRCAIR